MMKLGLMMTTLGLLGGCASLRGTGASTTVLQPVSATEDARLFGRETRLTLSDGVLTGNAPGGSYDVRVQPGEAKGVGPLGPVDVHIRPVASGLDLSGDWNGEPVHFLIGPDSIFGTAQRQISVEERSAEECHYDLSWMRGRPTYAGRSECGGTATQQRFDIRGLPGAPKLDEETAVLLVAYLVDAPT